MASKLTARQIEALMAGARGNAWGMRGTAMGGAKRRMIQRLVAQGLLTAELPYRLTDAGRAALDAATGTVTLPVAQVPPGDGWKLVTGNTFLNQWARP